MAVGSIAPPPLAPVSSLTSANGGDRSSEGGKEGGKENKGKTVIGFNVFCDLNLVKIRKARPSASAADCLQELMLGWLKLKEEERDSFERQALKLSLSLGEKAAAGGAAAAKHGKDASNGKGKQAPKPRSAYNIFSCETRPQVRKDMPGMPWQEITKELGKQWRHLSAADKKTWQDKARAETEHWKEQQAAGSGAGAAGNVSLKAGTSILQGCSSSFLQGCTRAEMRAAAGAAVNAFAAIDRAFDLWRFVDNLDGEKGFEELFGSNALVQPEAQVSSLEITTMAIDR